MEFAKSEVAAVEQVVVEAHVIQELNDLELTLVGGGIGTVVIA